MKIEIKTAPYGFCKRDDDLGALAAAVEENLISIISHIGEHVWELDAEPYCWRALNGRILVRWVKSSEGGKNLWEISFDSYLHQVTLHHDEDPILDKMRSVTAFRSEAHTRTMLRHTVKLMRELAVPVRGRGNSLVPSKPAPPVPEKKEEENDVG